MDLNCSFFCVFHQFGLTSSFFPSASIVVGKNSHNLRSILYSIDGLIIKRKRYRLRNITFYHRFFQQINIWMKCQRPDLFYSSMLSTKNWISFEHWNLFFKLFNIWNMRSKMPESYLIQGIWSVHFIECAGNEDNFRVECLSHHQYFWCFLKLYVTQNVVSRRRNRRLGDDVFASTI